MVKVKEIGVFLLRIIVSLAFLFFLLHKIDLKSVWEVIKGADIFLLAVAGFFNLLIYIACYYRWRMLLHSVGVAPEEKRLLSAFSGGVFFNLFLPSTIGGDVVRSIDLARRTHKAKEVVATVIADRLSGFVGMIIISLVALGLGLKLINDKAVILSILAMSVVLLLILLILFNERIFRLLNSFLGNIKWGGKITRGIQQVHEQLHFFRGRKWMLAQNVFLSVFVQFIGPIAAYFTAKAIGLEVSLLYFFIFLPVISAITALPISAGGLGLRDISTVYFFAKIGVAKNAAFAMSLLGFAFLALFAAIGGIIYVCTFHRRRV